MANVKNVNINVDTRESFTVDGNPDKVIYLDIHDYNVVNRLTEALKRMDSTRQRWTALAEKSTSKKAVEDDTTLDDIEEFSTEFKAVEAEMRSHLDYAFDSEGLCDTILGKSSIFASINGKMKFEQIIDALTNLYEANIKAETDKLNKRKVAAKTAKYTKK